MAFYSATELTNFYVDDFRFGVINECKENPEFFLQFLVVMNVGFSPTMRSDFLQDPLLRQGRKLRVLKYFIFSSR